jgi:serine protease Do
MTRRLVLSLLLLAVPALCAAEEKKAPKRSYVGIMIAAGKEKGTFLVTGVFSGGPADKAGLQAGDVILKIDGAVPPDLQTAVKVIGALKAGRKAALLVRRDGKEGEIEVVPASRDD